MNNMRIRARVVLVAVVLLAAVVSLTACRQREAQESEAPASLELSKATVEQVQQWIESGEPLVVLDSRSVRAWDTGTTKALGALRVPPDDIEPHLAEIPRDQRIVVYCT